MCFMISMPIQQFTSCFYVIPMEHHFFDQKFDQVDEQGDHIMTKAVGNNMLKKLDLEKFKKPVAEIEMGESKYGDTEKKELKTKDKSAMKAEEEAGFEKNTYVTGNNSDKEQKFEPVMAFGDDEGTIELKTPKLKSNAENSNRVIPSEALASQSKDVPAREIALKSQVTEEILTENSGHFNVDESIQNICTNRKDIKNSDDLKHGTTQISNLFSATRAMEDNKQ